MSKQINITRNEFKESYKKHYALYRRVDKEISPKTRRLILFYSVECGLKCLILKNIGKNTYEDLEIYSKERNLHINGHNINALIREIGMDKEYCLKRIKLSGAGGYVSSERFNELWRYGAAIEEIGRAHV